MFESISMDLSCSPWKLISGRVSAKVQDMNNTMSGRLPMIGSREHHRYFAETDNFKVSRAPTQRCGSVYGQFNGHDISFQPHQ
ncbi:hypothetical protein [Microseira wollei]|uniref:Uncharacterized protein n=1 Tax=Microseira wollei NIES-4236 TaxID=2530354 RepID=A0AAV3XF28_9CYAN|nr:hypothetical protein [Microseira wollei]GET38977.1 hypothetical protein MiSe_37370 [Microseira wollei NIES-4236]